MNNANENDKKNVFQERFRELVGDTATQEEIAKKVNTSRQNVGNWLNGKSKPDIYALAEIAKCYGVSTDYILGLTDIKTNDTTIQSVCEYTGLTESNVEFLRILEETKIIGKYDYFYNDVINLILSLLQSYGSLLTNVQELLLSDSYKWDSLSINELENEFPNLTQRIYGKGKFVTGYEYRRLLIATINRDFSLFVDCIEEMSKIDAQPHKKLNIWEKNTKRHLERFKHSIVDLKNILSNGLKPEEFIMIDIDSDK